MKVSDIVSALVDIVGEAYVVHEAGKLDWFVTDYRHYIKGEAVAAVRPKTTQDVSDILRFCHDNDIVVIPQGGNTSLVAGAVPPVNDPRPCVVVNCTRMNTIREIDVSGFTAVVEAGVILHELKRVLAKDNRFFPLAIASEGSSQIGGNISANAGGILTVGYGNTRDLILGLEVVLPNGDIWNGLNALRKDNTGYDLKHLFIGGEGTLGIVTAATVKLFPLPRFKETFYAALPSVEAAVDLFDRISSTASGSLVAYELMSRQSIDICLKHVDGFIDPLEGEYPWYVLGEIRASSDDDGMRQVFENVLAKAMDDEIISDAVIATNETKRENLWFCRESLSDGERMVEGSSKHDISVPIGKMPSFISEASKRVHDYMADIRISPFGHLGDGNIHYNLVRPESMTKSGFLEHRDALEDIVYEVVQDHGGSISAEHGLGHLKTKRLKDIKDVVALQTMKKVKTALDPKNIMNPGVIIEQT